MEGLNKLNVSHTHTEHHLPTSSVSISCLTNVLSALLDGIKVWPKCLLVLAAPSGTHNPMSCFSRTNFEAGDANKPDDILFSELSPCLNYTAWVLLEQLHFSKAVLNSHIYLCTCDAVQSLSSCSVLLRFITVLPTVEFSSFMCGFK